MTVQNGKTLQILNFWCGVQGLLCTLRLSSIVCILKNCSALKELHFWNGVTMSMLDEMVNGNLCHLCGIDNEALDYLVNNISTQIEKFSLGFDPYRGEEKIKTLVSRCTKLKELRLMCYTNFRNDSITHIIDHLKPTLEKLVIYDGGCGENDFDFRKLYELKSMPKLKNFYFTYNTPDKNVISELRYQLPNVSVNGHPPLASENGKS